MDERVSVDGGDRLGFTVEPQQSLFSGKWCAHCPICRNMFIRLTRAGLMSAITGHLNQAHREEKAGSA